MDNNFNRIFNNTTNSYKFYWWLSIIEIAIEKDKCDITYQEITQKIISKLWYPVNFFKLSFGKQDQYAKHIKSIKNEFNLEDNIEENDLSNFLEGHKNSRLLIKINTELTKYVPYRFVRPWYAQETMGLKDYMVNDKIQSIQNNQAPYKAFRSEKKVVLNEQWFSWIKENYSLVRYFTMFHLLQYLEKHNPTVANLSKKLEKPTLRNLTKATKYWKGFILNNGNVLDVFQKKPLKEIEFVSIDHFLPWSFTGHDLLWNLHPLEKKLNSSKNNNLPKQTYFPKFYNLQYNFCNYLLENKFNKAVEEYILLFNCSISELKEMNNCVFSNKMDKSIIPQYEIAKNMGFNSDWKI